MLLDSVLAHQGGWDEALMVLVPIAVFAAILVLANRRAKAIHQRRAAENAPDEVAAEPTGEAEDQ